jgi:hypothetical protein
MMSNFQGKIFFFFSHSLRLAVFFAVPYGMNLLVDMVHGQGYSHFGYQRSAVGFVTFLHTARI